MFEQIKELYGKLPDEVTVFIEYLLPSAILTALVDYLVSIEISNVYIAAVINIVIIFIRQIKPRREAKE